MTPVRLKPATTDVLLMASAFRRTRRVRLTPDTTDND